MKGKFAMIIFIFLITISFLPLAAEETEKSEGFELDLGRFYLSFNPKIFEDGTQNDYSFGIFYNDALKWGGEIKFRTIDTSGNDTIWEITDSMSAYKQKAYEVFLLPVNYHFFRKAGFTMRAGAGIYYNYNKSETRGFFNDSSLYEPAGPDHFNNYNYDFSGHALGPIVDIGISWRGGFFYGSFSAGVVPISYFNQKQSLKISPLMEPPSFSVSGESASGPYYYLNLDAAVITKYFTLFITLFNEFSRLSYTSIGFDDNGEWTGSDITQDYRVLALEISLLINLGPGGLLPQIGYGRTFEEESGGRNYLLIGVKKSIF